MATTDVEIKFQAISEEDLETENTKVITKGAVTFTEDNIYLGTGTDKIKYAGVNPVIEDFETFVQGL